VACEGAIYPFGFVAVASGQRGVMLGTGREGKVVIARTTPGVESPEPKCREPAPTVAPGAAGFQLPPPALQNARGLRLDRSGRFSVRISTQIPARVTVTGYVRLKGLRSRLGLSPVRRRNIAPGDTTLLLAVNGREARALARRHRRGGKARVEVSVREYWGPRRAPTTFKRTLPLARSR
jgi:hypothetical protein